MQINNIEQIVNGMQLYLPSGIIGIVSMNDEGNIIVEYRDEMDSLTDTYTQDEFGELIKDGVEVFEQPSQLVMESCETEYIKELTNKLDRIAKACDNTTLRLEATKLMDSLALGVDITKEANELFKKVEKYHKNLKESKMDKKDLLEQELSQLINEVSDELASKVNAERVARYSDAFDKEEDKFNKYAKIRKRKNKLSFDNDDLDYVTDKQRARKEWGDAEKELGNSEKKLSRNIDLTLGRSMRKATADKPKNEAWEDESNTAAKANAYLWHCVAEAGYRRIEELAKSYTVEGMEKYFGEIENDDVRKYIQDIVNELTMNEAFTDEMSMLTDVNDMDFPSALQDTVETDAEGQLITLGNIIDQLADMKDEIKGQIEDLRTEIRDIKDKVEDTADVAEETQDTVEDELTDEDLADLDDVEFEDKETEEKPEDEKDDDEDEDEEDEDENEEEENLEESFKQYLRTGKYEDLQKTKQEVDKMQREGKSAEEIKDAITLMSDNDKEKEEATEYATANLKESLLNTKYSSKLSNL